MIMTRSRALVPALAVATFVAGCKRENRYLNDPAPPAPSSFVRVSDLQPGPVVIGDTSTGPFDNNAYGTAEGQQLFEQMNCSGCHSNGGGGMGPALMDDQWIYGSEPDQIFATIAQGRPNGMPAWKNRLTTKQIWELVAYVRSLSGLTPKGARPSREDHMMTKPAPAETPKTTTPRNSGPPG